MACLYLYVLIQMVICYHNILLNDIEEVTLDSCTLPCTKTDQILRCNYCNCTSLPDLYNNAYYSEQVLLSSNYIVNLTYIDKLYLLRHLDLSDNQINYIEDETFRDQIYLETLNLARNNLTELRKEHFVGLSALKELHLNGNLLKVLADNLFYNNLKQVTTLYLGDNKIKELDHNAFTDMPSLTYLHLDNNRIHKVELNHFLGLDLLENVVLKNNRITVIPMKIFTECPSFRSLDLRNNFISRIAKDAFFKTDNLNTLHLSSNRLPNITIGMFDGLSNLQSLYLDHNPIEVIQPGSLPNSLVKISLKSMPGLTKISNKTFTNTPKLTTFEMNNNIKMTLIEAGAFQDDTTRGRTTSVQDVDLYNNSLMYLPVSLLNWTLVDEPVLSGNNWVCDCNLAWVRTMFSVDIQKEIICSQPHHLHGISVNNVDFTQFSCSFFTTHRYQLEITLIFFITVLFGTVAGLLLYRFRHSLFPCCFIIPGKYTSMYDAINTDDDEKVKLKLGKEGKYGSKEQILPGPTSV